MFFNKKMLACLALCIGLTAPAAAEEIDISKHMMSSETWRSMVQESYLKKKRALEQQNKRVGTVRKARPNHRQAQGYYPPVVQQQTVTVRRQSAHTQPRHQPRPQPVYQETEADRLLGELAAVRAREAQQRKNNAYPF
ncbi:hypothetical protein [Conchiformibius steedae]|uniref:hypothetical protein n=1 Tax=Conchiformibius steedae TaxID=153493 RepID=UPI0026F27FC2|nr:hypothetical protein [Conchiformibius steedae]